MYGATTDGPPLLVAARWLESLLHGQLITVMAVLAVAAVGFRLLTGHLALRRAASVALGCFLLFGASAIARGIVGLTTLNSAPMPALAEPTAVASPHFQDPLQPLKSDSVDPYAGASVSR